MKVFAKNVLKTIIFQITIQNAFMVNQSLYQIILFYIFFHMKHLEIYYRNQKYYMSNDLKSFN